MMDEAACVCCVSSYRGGARKCWGQITGSRRVLHVDCTHCHRRSTYRPPVRFRRCGCAVVGSAAVMLDRRAY